MVAPSTYCMLDWDDAGAAAVGLLVISSSQGGAVASSSSNRPGLSASWPVCGL
jgi:hypothetical protein